MRRVKWAAALGVLLALQPAVAAAIVTRHDVLASRYLADPDEIPALADLPVEGHGVLIAPRWVVTVAHAVRGGAPAFVTINGRQRPVARLVVHPSFRLPADDLLAMTGDAGPLMSAMAQMDDLALIELVEPVEDVRPLPIRRGDVEAGQVVRIYGKGATGDGLTGQYADAPRRDVLRRAENRIVSAEGRWLVYVFDQGANALPLEGMLGDGDSGGAVVIDVEGRVELAALSDWKAWTGDLSGFRAGVYGQASHHIRLAHYADWIDTIIAGDAAA